MLYQLSYLGKARSRHWPGSKLGPYSELAGACPARLGWAAERTRLLRSCWPAPPVSRTSGARRPHHEPVSENLSPYQLNAEKGP